MSYTPPAGNAVLLNFDTPPNPTTSPVLFKFGVVGLGLFVAAQTLAPFTQTADALVLAVRNASAAQTLSSVVQAATLRSTVQAGAAQTLSPVVQAAPVAVRAALAAAQTLTSFSTSATATLFARASAGQVLDGIIQQAGSSQDRYLFAAQTLTSFTQAASVEHYVVVYNSRAFFIPAERRALAIRRQTRDIDLEP